MTRGGTFGTVQKYWRTSRFNKYPKKPHGKLLFFSQNHCNHGAKCTTPWSNIGTEPLLFFQFQSGQIFRSSKIIFFYQKRIICFALGVVSLARQPKGNQDVWVVRMKKTLDVLQL